MATGTGGYGDQTIDSGLCGLLGMAASGDVMEYQATVAMYGIHHLLDCPEAGDDDWYLVLDADFQICLQPWVAVVHDQVHGIGRGILQDGQARFDLLQPGLETAAFALVECREATDHAVATAGQDQFRLEIRNIGAATTGRRKRCSSKAGRDIGIPRESS